MSASRDRASAQPLERIDEGPGEGERLLPVENTSSPVDLDLINNIMRLPYRERFRILLSELGTGLAGRGEELNEVIHRANPALRETDRVLAILARQNHVLARLARDSDAALGAAGSRAAQGLGLDRPGQRDRPGLGRAQRPTSAAASTGCPPSCASCGR